MGEDAPVDSPFLTKWFYNFRLQIINQQPEATRAAAVVELDRERFESWENDSEWARWYDYYRGIVLRPADWDVAVHVQRGLGFNLETAAVYVLISAWFVPAVRHWWCILPACLWTLILFAEEWWNFRQGTDKWSTLDAQIIYLTELVRSKR